MKIRVKSYIGKNITGLYTVTVDKDMKNRLYSVFTEPTFVFMSKVTYNAIPKEIQQTVEVLEDNAGLTVDEILGKDVMFVLISKETDECMVDAIVDMAEQYTGRKLRYLVTK